MQSRPGWTLTDLADRLERTGDRLGELAAGTRQLRAVFDLSYQALDTEQQRVFRLLGLHPGQEFTADVGRGARGLPTDAARQVLDRLVDEHLVIAVTGDRYRLHDLLARLRRPDRRDRRARRCGSVGDHPGPRLLPPHRGNGEPC